MERMWFLLHNGFTDGPLTADEIEAGLGQGRWPLASLIWWKGAKQWMPVGIWRAHLSMILDSLRKKPVSHIWYLKSEGRNDGPFSDDQLVQKLASLRDPKSATVWTEGLKQWRSVLEFKQIATALGIPPRAMPRVTLDGRVEIIVGPDEKRTVALNTIGSGGAGFAHADGTMPGQEIRVAIHSEKLPTVVHAQAQVLYMNREGVTGIRFTQIQPESQASIIDAVRGILESDALPLVPFGKSKGEAA